MLWTGSLPHASSGSPARGASTFPCRSRRSSPSSVRRSSHPEAVAVHETRDPRILLRAHVLLEAREDLFLFHVRMARDEVAELADLLQPVGRIRAHLVEFIDE